MKRLVVAGLTGYVIGLKLASWAARGAMEAARTIGRTENTSMTLEQLGPVRIVRASSEEREAFLASLADQIEEAAERRRKAVLN